MTVIDDLLRGSLDHCVKCTICETQCPVSNVTPLFPGPKYAGPQAERYRSRMSHRSNSSVDYCSGCGICSQSCPQGVKIAEINSQARNKLKRQKGIPLRDRIITRPTWLGRAGTPVAPLANLTIDRPLRILGEKLLGVHRDAPAPEFAGRRFSRWAQGAPEPARPGARSSTSTAAAPSTTSRGRARRSCRSSSTTGSRSWSPSRTAADCRCSRAGCSTTPARSCCGLPARSSPYVRDDPDTLIVGNATSCTLMLKREAREILSLEHDPDLKLVSERT